MRRTGMIAIIAIVVIALIATIVVVALALNRAGAQPTGNLVTGSVTYTEEIVPAADWVTQVELVLIPLEGESEQVIASQDVTGFTAIPIPFSIQFDPGQIDPDRDYIVRAKILDSGGTLQFQSTAVVPVITKERPATGVEIVVQYAGMEVGEIPPADALPSGASVSGTLNYIEAVTLPPDATAYIQLLNAAIADPAAALIGEQILPSPGQKPIPFNVIFDPARIDPAQSYVLQARIVDNANIPLFATPAGVLVLTGGQPSAGVELILQQVGAVPPGEAYVTGVLTYLERMALPEDVRALVRLLDITVADAPAIVIDTQTIQNPGQIPIAFSLRYQPSTIIDTRTYSVEGRINDSSGNLMFISTQPYPVITQGRPTIGIEVVMEFVVKGLHLPFYGFGAQ